MSIDFRSSETEPNDGSTAADLRTPFQSFKSDLPRRAPSGPSLSQVPKLGRFYDVARDVIGIKTAISNVFMIGAPGSAEWVLVDAGMPGYAGTILSAAERRFGANVPPVAILLTHGHFDHVGSLQTLLEHWDVPVYAHSLEMPYLTGRSSYPPPDPTVGNGAMAVMSSMYPKKPIDLGSRVRVLPPGGLISQLPDWRWIHTPGHSPGHVSFFREQDRVLVAGDAVVTVRAESLLANITLTPEMHGPPMYFTPDWQASRASVHTIAQLNPEVLATGHGIPLHGAMMQEELRRLLRDFELRAVPDQGRYVRGPAVTDENGVVYVPPSIPQPERSAALIGAGVVAGLLLGLLTVPKRRATWRDLF